MGDLDNTPANIQLNIVDSNSDSNVNQNKSNNKKDKNKNNATASYYEYNDYNFDEDINNDFDDEALINQIKSMDILATKNLNDNTNNFDEVLDNIMNITMCYDISLIKDVYNQNNFNADLTIQNLLSLKENNENNDNENEAPSTTDNDNGSSSSKNNKKFKNLNLRPREKKQLKKQKQMERQRLKVLEERDNERNQNSKDNIKNNSEAANNCANTNEQNNENVISCLPSSIEAKSI